MRERVSDDSLLAVMRHEEAAIAYGRGKISTDQEVVRFREAVFARLDAMEAVVNKARDVVRSRRVDWQPIQRDWAGLEKAVAALDASALARGADGEGDE